MCTTFLFYIFLLLNNEVDILTSIGISFYSTADSVFGDYDNYFLILFVVLSASGVSFIFERIYDQKFNIGIGLLKNKKFREGS